MAHDRRPRSLGLFGLLLAASATAGVGIIAQAPATPAREVTFTQRHRAHPAAELSGVPSRRRRRADGARHVRRREAVGQVDEDADRSAQPARRDAAVLRREEHRHPEVQARPVAQRRRDREVARWVDSGAPRGNPADMPKPLQFDSTDKWTIGEPDLVLRSKDVTVPAIGPDKWGDFGLVPTGLTEDRYVSAVEVREVNDIPQDRRRPDGRRTLRLPPHDVLQRRRRRASRAAAPTKAAAAGRFTRSDATRTSFRRRPAGCSPRIRRWR